jgi:hypothetical protein
MLHIPKPLELPVLFILHILTGLILFAVVGLAAMAVHYVGQRLGGDGLSYYVISGVNFLSLFLFAADFICIVLFVGTQTGLFVKDITKYAQKSWDE